MFVPLTVEKKVIGCLFLGHREVHRFSPGERWLATVLGSQAGVILANLRLYEQKDAALAEQKQITLRHDALYQIATEIYRGESLEASLRRLADAAPAVLRVDICIVGLRREFNQLSAGRHVKLDPKLIRPAEVEHLIGDATKARMHLGWAPSVDFAGLVKMMVDADVRRVSEAPQSADRLSTL